MSNDEPIQTSPYELRSSPIIGDGYAEVRIDECGNFAVVTRGKPKALSALLRLIADEIDLGEDWGGDPAAGLPHEDSE